MKKQKKTIETPKEAIAALRRKAIDRRDINSFLIRLVAFGIFLYVLFGVLFRLVPVPNEDMRPTLRARDLQLVYCYPSNLWNNDLVVYEYDGSLKTGRIVARPGDSVEITEEKTLRVNGSQVYEGEIYYETPAYDSDVEYPVQLGDDEYFILTDYREGGMDSRQFGPVKREDITGKLLAVLRRSGL